MTDYRRQTELFDPDVHQVPVTVIGVGGIGGPAALALAKLGIKELTLVDDDVVEAHNLPNQLVIRGSEGFAKVDIVAELLRSLSAAKIQPMKLRADDTPSGFAAQTPGAFQGVVISAVDSMASRQVIWKQVRYQAAVPLFIDGRMGGEIMRVYSVRPCQPDDVARYEATLYSSEETAPLRCGAEAIIYATMVVGALIARAVAKHLTGGTLPFETVMDLAQLQLFTS